MYHEEIPTTKNIRPCLGKPKISRMTSSSDAPADLPRQPGLLERMCIHLRTWHYSIRTEQAYLDWVQHFILFHDKRHPREMGAAEGEAFLSHLAVNRQVSASTPESGQGGNPVFGEMGLDHE